MQGISTTVDYIVPDDAQDPNPWSFWPIPIFAAVPSTARLFATHSAYKDVSPSIWSTVKGKVLRARPGDLTSSTIADVENVETSSSFAAVSLDKDHEMLFWVANDGSV